MSDSYQAIYDATRSRISGGSITDAVGEAISNALGAVNLSYLSQIAEISISEISGSMLRPSVLMRPSLKIDGNQWCALYGENLQDGVAGFGDTPEKAMLAFDAAWIQPLKQNG